MIKTPEELARLSVLAKNAEVDDLIYREWVRSNKASSIAGKTTTSAIRAADAPCAAQGAK